MLNQVWLNLLDNAIKFTPTQGIIEVIVQEKESDVLVTISDTGCESPIKPFLKFLINFIKKIAHMRRWEMDWDCLLFMKL